MFWKELYYKGEEKWYAFWDKVNEHLPVYKIIDKIDAVAPSFLLFLILLLFIILSGLFVLLVQSDANYTAEFSFIQSDGKTKLTDSIVNIQIIEAGQKTSDKNYRTNSDGIVKLKDLKYGNEVKIIVNLTKGTYNKSFFIEKFEMKEKIVLLPKIILEPKKIVITTVDNSGMTIQESMEVEFWCENGAVKSEPQKATTNRGIIEVTEPVNCVKLYASPNSSTYEKRTYLISSTNYYMTLTKQEVPKTELTVKVRFNGSPINDTSFNVNVNGKEYYNGKTLTSSQAIISLVPGTYTVSVSDPTNKYATKIENNVIVQTKKEITIEVTKEIRARISVKTIDLLTKSPIIDATVTLKNSIGAVVDERKTDTSGNVQFAIIDVGDYQVSAKKVGDLNGGYYVKTINMPQISSDTNTTLELERITIANAGKTIVRVIDQQQKPVSNAKIFLKYKETDAIVELNQNNNWAMTDVNGYVTFLAGKVEGSVYAYAIKYPFSGFSEAKTLSIDKSNEFTINMNVGEATIIVNLVDESGQKIDGTARILLTEDNSDLSGLMLIENGAVQRKIKAGQQVYLAIQSDTFENYITEPRMLFPNKTYTYKIIMKKQISKVLIDLENIYNENDTVTRTLQAGKKYYAKLILEADKDYSRVLAHFRVGTEKLLENDYMEIDKVEAANFKREVRGTSYDPERGYTYDAANITDGYAKWVNVEFDDFDKGTRVLKVWFNIKRNAPGNKELKFFYRADFDGEKDPNSTNTGNELYDDAKPSNVYYVGEEATCDSAFCITNETLYWDRDDLYINAPFEVSQAENYTYKYQLVNNSETDYGTNVKKMYLNLQVLNEDKVPIKVMEYKIKDNSKDVGGDSFTSISNYEVGSFNKNTAIDFSFKIEGNEVGTGVIKLELKADGVVLYTKESTFIVPSEKEMSVSVSPNYIPSLANTPMVVTVKDDKGEPINKAIVRVYAKEAGFDEYLIDSQETNRVGKTQVDSGAHYKSTKIIIEVTKEGFARKRLSTTITDDVVVFNPDTVTIALNTISKREDKKSVSVGNQTIKDLKIISIRYDTTFDDVINEEAMKNYTELLIGTIIPGEELVDLDLVKVKLINSITQDNFMEPIDLEGDLIVTFQIPNTGAIYDKTLPIRITVSSEADVETSCLILKDATQSKTTQLGQVSFTFEMLNNCGVDLTGLYATSSGEIKGEADVSLVSASTGNSGRSALDGGKRKTFEKMNEGETLIGTVTYTPSTDAVGTTQSIAVVLEGKFQDTTIKTSPASLNFTINVLNLSECMTISSNSSPVAFDETTELTVDASNCLGQKIEVYLCRNDAGCSGGAEGKISLSKRTFTLQNSAETISAYSPSIPGTYGVTVYARVKGKSSYSYIGEVPVSFKEDEDKFFKLSKYDISIVGTGSEDVILLENEMLQQTVTVKANDCVWGEKDADWGSSEWLMLLTTTASGAALGNMIGSNFNRDRTTTTRNEEEGELTSEEQNTRNSVQSQLNEIQEIDGDQIYNNLAGMPSESDPTAGSGYFDESTGTIYNGTTENGIRTISTYNPSSNTITQQEIGRTVTVGNDTYTISTVQTINGYGTSSQTNSTTITFHNNNTGRDFVYNNPAQNTVSTQFTRDATNYSNSWARKIDTVTPNWLRGLTSTRYSGNWNTPSTNPTNSTSNLQEKELSTSKSQNLFSSLSTGFLLPSYLSEVNDLKNGYDSGYYLSKSLMSKTYASASFEAPAAGTTTTGSIKWGSGIGTVIGAIVGAYIGYLAAEAGLYKCAENFQTAEYNDFVILLQGDSMSVVSPDGETTEERVVPSDAGALGFTLSGVGVTWDFTDADYGETENVGLKFTNSGINEASPKYGTLTINANKHTHGQLATLEEDDSSSSGENDYDVECLTDTFGDYWIGDTNDDGLCSPVSVTNYSQKYHIRVISGDSNDDSAYLDKENSCNNGTLTGSTGSDALPKIKLGWDWSDIDYDTCTYENEDYVYCDATQNMIGMVKRLARLEEFLRANAAVGCPTDAITSQVIDVTDELNSYTTTVPTGQIGFEDLEVTLNLDSSVTARAKVNNQTGGPFTSYYSYAVKGSGAAVTPEYPIEKEFPAGISYETIEIDSVSTYEGTYFFTVVFNGEKGTRTAITRSFLNRESTATDTCWIDRTTRKTGGVSSIAYYYADSDTIVWTNDITNSSDLFDHLNFGSYMIRDNYNSAFLTDFANYYSTNFGEQISATEKSMLNLIKSGKLKFSKRYSGDTEFEAGLYDTWFYIDFGDSFSIIDSNADVEVSLLSIRNPVETFPFYYIPFDGLVGEEYSRNGYGSVYKNLTEGKGKEIQLNSSDALNTVRTFENITGTGIITVSTKNGANLVAVNSSVGTRGELATVSYSGNDATINFTPNYATPIIVKKALSGTTGSLGVNILENQQTKDTGGNLTYWTGAAKSRDFYGTSAVEVYNNSADSKLDDIDAYGFSWTDATQSGNLYLKTIIYVPTDKDYILQSEDSTTTIWSPNDPFSNSQQIVGIKGMTQNDKLNNSSFSTLQDLFDLVKNEKVCVSNDGSNMLFWWNTKVLANTEGTQSSLESYEVTLIGK